MKEFNEFLLVSFEFDFIIVEMKLLDYSDCSLSVMRKRKRKRKRKREKMMKKKIEGGGYHGNME